MENGNLANRMATECCTQGAIPELFFRVRPVRQDIELDGNIALKIGTKVPQGLEWEFHIVPPPLSKFQGDEFSGSQRAGV